MKVLLLGGGAREHALAISISKSPLVTELLAIPGNAGIASVARCIGGSVEDIDLVVTTALAEDVDLVVVGPEGPLVKGVQDALAAAKISAFGPSKKAAQLEGSKAFSKAFMQRHGIPTSGFVAFENADDADAYLDANFPKQGIVVKADGLAAGKGVVVAETIFEAKQAVDSIMRQKLYGAAGDKIVIEQRIFGPEISYHALLDGRTFIPLGAAQDHKRLLDGDRGPNTGGMGAYSPPIEVSDALEQRILRDVVAKVAGGMAAEGALFRGALFCGLMLGEPGADGVPSINVLEFNVRFGDPETAVLLARVAGDLVPYFVASAHGDFGELANMRPPATADAAIAVVIAAEGYPASPKIGDPIKGLEKAGEIEGVHVLHAGTSSVDGQITSKGGRVLCVTARGIDIDEAANRAYRAIAMIDLRGSHHRKDIGYRARKV